MLSVVAGFRVSECFEYLNCNKMHLKSVYIYPTLLSINGLKKINRGPKNHLKKGHLDQSQGKTGQSSVTGNSLISVFQGCLYIIEVAEALH